MENKMDKVKCSLQNIVEAYGITIFDEINRINALLMDYLPKQIKERKLIVSALEEGVAASLGRVVNKDKTEQTLCIKRCIKNMVNEAWVAEEAARFAVGAIAYAIGLNATIEPRLIGCTQMVETELTKGAYDGTANSDEFLQRYKTIGYKAFSANQRLTELRLPNNIKEIKPKAFSDCINLKKIILSSKVESIGACAFVGCDALENIEIEQNAYYSMVGGMLIEKKTKALMRATRAVREKCYIPHEVTFIQSFAFERSNVREIVLPRNLERVGNGAFTYCGYLQRFTIDPHNEKFVTIDGVLHTRDRKQLLRFPSGYAGVNYIVEDTVLLIADGSFSGTANLETLTFTSSLKAIGKRAFEYCNKLSSLVLPSSVEVIEERAFQFCNMLSSIMLPRGINEIGDFAFYGCKSIQTVSIPRSVRRIGHSAFRDCSSLKKIIIQDNVDFIGDGAFIGCSPELEVVSKNNDYVQRYCNAHIVNWSAL